MTAIQDQAHDALSLLRRSIADNVLPIPTTVADASDASAANVPFAEASFLIFNPPNPSSGEQRISIALNQQTRFVSPAAGGLPLDLRSVFFCWINRDTGVGEYIAATQSLNDALQALGREERVTNLVFAEKLDLVTWLAGEIGEGDSEHIQSIGANDQTRNDARTIAETLGASGDIDMNDADTSNDAARKREDDRLREIYAKERKMGDCNTILRGVKVQDFGDIRKRYSALFFGKTRGPATNSLQANAGPVLNGSHALRPTVKPAPSNRRPEPIILLSPSASSLLRLPNIKSFLEDGKYVEPESGTSANILHLMRLLPSVSSKPIRFIIVDDPSSFRPDYWERLVAVFTTGQTWQFKHYKWSHPADLFAHALGIYVGYKGEVIPDAVKGWGRGVLSVQIDKGPNRWRDREVVEDVWRGIEGHMKARGWGKDGK